MQGLDGHRCCGKEDAPSKGFVHFLGTKTLPRACPGVSWSAFALALHRGFSGLRGVGTEVLVRVRNLPPATGARPQAGDRG